MYGPGGNFVDPSAYRAIFFEETQDHLADVERILLGLQPEQPYLEDLNAIFRAVHSIKGSAAMLGSWVFIVHLPRALAAGTPAEARNEWTALFEALLFAGTALIVAGTFALRSDNGD